MMNWEKLCPNLSFTLKIRWKIYTKQGGSHFKLDVMN